VYSTLEFDKIRDKVSSFASSPLGEELALQIKPVRDNQLLQTFLSQTAELKNLVEYDSSPPIDGIFDIRSALLKLSIEGTVFSLDELSKIYSTLKTVRQLSKYFIAKEEKSKSLHKITIRLVPLFSVEKELEKCIDFSSLEIKDSASPELAQIRSTLSRARESARRKLDSLLKNYSSQGMLQENVISVRDGRFVLVVRDEYKRKIKGLVHDQSASGSSYFIEPLETLEDNNRIRELVADEQKEMRIVLLLLTNGLRSQIDEIQTNVDVLAKIDLIYAKALFAIKSDSFQPEIVNKSYLEIFEGRHPLLLLRMGKKSVVPMDLSLGGDTNTLVISGPNAGGKTVALKTVGLLTLMARSGLLIPALPHTKIGIIDQVFACIGDQQSIENDLSTFSSHIESLKNIANNATAKSLVLIDEIASGTDPEEGTALAMAIIQHLTSLRSKNIVTTHLSALKAFAYKNDRVENASLEFNVKTLGPTFIFRTGIPGSSYAFEIAKRMGFPDELTSAARKLVGHQKNQLEDLIIELESKLNSYKDLVAKAHVKETEFRGLAKLYSEKKQNLEKYEKRQKKHAAEEAEKIISETNATIERAIKEIREAGAEKSVIKKARELVVKQKEIIAKTKAEANEQEVATFHKIEQGDYVKWNKTGGEGFVMTNPDKQHKVFIQAGGAKIKVPVAELAPAKQPKPVKRMVKTNVVFAKKYSGELDLRGRRLDEAKDQVDQFLDEAILTGLQQVTIIHGKGTGSLRAGLSTFLQSHPFVANTRLGNWNEGDSGVTVVQLRDQ
jgi:DNA mismatch repair protein MutS2